MIKRETESRASSDSRRASRGQSLVELALILPVLLLLLMMALDFGRVYLGWINLQSMARIAANYAANNAEGFQTSDPAILAAYQRQVLNDAQASNCALPIVGGKQTAPAPTFTGYKIGDRASVAISCRFGVITPIISNVVGSTLTVSASSEFPVKVGMVDPGPGGGGGPIPPAVASFSCAPTAGPATLNVDCSDESGGAPTSWLWQFLDGATVLGTATSQDASFAFPNPGLYTVKLTVDNAAAQPSTLTKTNYISVNSPSVVDFTADKTFGPRPLTVKFTDNTAPAGTAWQWDFDNNGTVDATGSGTPSWTYNTAGQYSVKMTVTNANGTTSVTKTNYIRVDVPTCTVPDFNGVKFNAADNLWSKAGFTTTVQKAPGAPPGQGWIIHVQSVVATSPYPCDGTIQVTDK